MTPVINPSVQTGLRTLRNWLSPIFDPIVVVRGLFAYPRHFADWRRHVTLLSAGWLCPVKVPCEA
ncbi:MAG: hypothetical protein IMZ53_09130 [Thermoplasmata archaeon]|nr:hypothetical protein [Thermoplasmata archaeon]